MIASFERYVKRKNYEASIINDFVFEKTLKTLQCKQKQLKKQRKRSKQKASLSLTKEEIKVITKDFLECQVQKRFSTLFA